MANTYSQIYIHLIFAVQGRQNLINNSIKDEIYKYISGLIRNRKNKLLIINGMPDHIHILIALNPDISVSDLVKDIKIASSKFINNKNWFIGKFHWQEGYGAFSYSRSQLDKVYKYILHQESHHKKNSFKEEYINFLKKFAVEYNEKYLFKWIKDEESN